MSMVVLPWPRLASRSVNRWNSVIEARVASGASNKATLNVTFSMFKRLAFNEEFVPQGVDAGRVLFHAGGCHARLFLALQA